MSIQPGSGYTFTSSSLGHNLNIEKPWAPIYAGGDVKPFTVTLGDGDVGVSPGTVNRYIPTIDGEYIDKDPPPRLTVSDEGYVLIKATYEEAKFFPRTAEIVFEAGEEPPIDTENESYYPLAKINSPTGGGLSITAYINDNLIVNRLKAGDSTATWWWTKV